MFCCIGVNNFDRWLSTLMSEERVALRASPKPVNDDKMFISDNLEDGVWVGLVL